MDDYDKYIERQYQKNLELEYQDILQIAKTHKKYLNSLQAVIKITCKKNCIEIDKIWKYYSFFLDLKLPIRLRNTQYVSIVYMPSMISTFLDLLTMGQYTTAYLPLRQIFESFLRAIYGDVNNKKIDYIRDWITQSTKNNVPMSGKKDSVIVSLTANKQLKKYPLAKNLSDLWHHSLCFKVHKPDMEVLLSYEYDSNQFDELYELFTQMIELLLTILAFNFPMSYDCVKQFVNNSEIESSFVEYTP